MAAPIEDDQQPWPRLRPLKLPDAVSDAVKPFTRTGRYVSQSWHDYRHHDDYELPDELPIARPTFALAAQAFRDEVVLAGLKARRPVSRPREFARIHDEVVEALEFYGGKGWLDKPKGFFGVPPPLSDVKIRNAKGLFQSHQRILFDSEYQPYPGEPGRERYLGYVAGRQVPGLLLRHSEPRPWLICVHGTEMGRAALDLTLFRARKLHEELGLNVVLPVLPMHGPRAAGLPKQAVFPGEDVLDDVHATAQAVWDIRRVVS